MGKMRKAKGCVGCLVMIFALIVVMSCLIGMLLKPSKGKLPQGVAPATSGVAPTPSTAIVNSSTAAVSSLRRGKVVSSQSCIDQRTPYVAPSRLDDTIEQATGSIIAVIMMVLVGLVWLVVGIVIVLVTATGLAIVYRMFTS